MTTSWSDPTVIATLLTSASAIAIATESSLRFSKSAKREKLGRLIDIADLLTVEFIKIHQSDGTEGSAIEVNNISSVPIRNFVIISLLGTDRDGETVNEVENLRAHSARLDKIVDIEPPRQISEFSRNLIFPGEKVTLRWSSFISKRSGISRYPAQVTVSYSFNVGYSEKTFTRSLDIAKHEP